MLNILLTNFHPLEGGGHVTYVKSLVSKHPDDLNLIIASPYKSKLYTYAKDSGLECVAIDFPSKLKEVSSIILNIIKLRRILIKQRFHLIHCNGSPDHKLVTLTLFTLRPSGRPKVIFTKHNSFPLKTGIIANWRFTKLTHAIITVCSRQLLEIKRNERFKEVCSVNIPNGVDLKHFHPRSDDCVVRTLRKELDIPSDKIVFISCSGTATHKGWMFLAAACKQYEDLCVLVLGGRPNREKLESFFPEGVPKNLTFPGQKDDVRPFLWAADIGFVLSTDVETISFACREMMACGLPMLVSDVGCLAENVDESCGWIVEPANSNVIANLIPAILQADLQQMSQAARLKAERSFDVENFTSRTYQVYREVSEATNGL